MQTLQSFCLNRIATSFDRYHYVYSTTKNEDLQGALLFLQRFYSHELVTRLNRGYRLKEKHADFIFNKFLKYMDTDWLTNFSWDGIVNIFERIGPTLEKISFDRGMRRLNSDLPWWDVIRHLPNVKAINYQQMCNNIILKRIAKNCPMLEKLDIENSIGVNNDGIKHFYEMKKVVKRTKDEQDLVSEQEKELDVPCPLIKEINLNGTRVLDNGVEQLLKKLPLLEEVDYAYLPQLLYEMHKNDLDSIDQVQGYKLTYLNLAKCCDEDDGDGNEIVPPRNYDEMFRICVTLCPNLKYLYCVIANVEHLNLCATLSHVEDFDLRCVPGSRIDTSDLLEQKSDQLKCLTLRNCTVLFSVLTQCRDLKQLIMDKVCVVYEESDFVFPSLEILTFINTDLKDSGVSKSACRIMASSPVLEDLCFVSTWPSKFTREIKTAVLRCCEQCPLDCISFSGFDEEEFFKDVLLTCSTLKSLDIEAFINLGSLRRLAGTLPNKPEVNKWFFCELE